MRITYKNLHERKVSIIADTLEDLWHLEKVILPGDKVSGSTFRSVKIKGVDKKLEKRPVFLIINVESVEYHKFSNALRILGKITSGHPEDLVNIGEHHTFEVTPGTKIEIIKDWRQFELDRLYKAEKETKQPKVLLICVDDELAQFAVITSIGVEMGVEIPAQHAGKQYTEKSAKEKYYEDVYLKISQSRAEKIVIVGPGFEKENFQKFLKSKYPKALANMLFEKVNNSGAAGVEEALKLGVVDKVISDNEMAKQSELVEEVLKRLSKEGAITFGPKQVAQAAAQGAVEDLLITDEFLRLKRNELEKTLDDVEKGKGRIHIVNSEGNVGRQVEGLGKIVALLRYKL